MALSGAHIACGYAATKGRNGAALPLLNRILWAQTMASAGTTTLGAPPVSDQDGTPIFEIYSAADIFVAIGSAPDATAGKPRIFVPANQTVDIGAENTGDKLAWILA